MGPGFESLRVYKISESLTIIVDALLAQLVEQLTLNQWVQGSNPWGCTEAVRQNEEKLWKSIGFQSFFYFLNSISASVPEIPKNDEQPLSYYLILAIDTACQ